MWLVPLQGFLKIKSYQHGFLPHRGTGTAWKEILTKVIPSSNIYEFDLKQFFPSVNVEELQKALIKDGLPNHVLDFLVENCSSAPLLPKVLLDREKGFSLNNMESLKANVNKDFTRKPVTEDDDEFKLIPKSILRPHNQKDPLFSREDWFQAPGAYLHPQIGLPQGSPLSPLLSIYLLDKGFQVHPKGINFLLYADDGLFYSDSYDTMRR